MKKKNKKYKKKKKILYGIIIICLLLLFTYLFDKEVFNSLKGDILEGIDNVTNTITSAINSIDINNEKDNNYEIVKLDGDLLVYFIDVGQADSILIKSNDSYMLIDAGNNNDGEKLVKYFNALGIDEFEYVVGTHAHEDHIGGMDNIIKNFKIKNFYMPNATTTTQTFLEVLNALEDKKVKFQTPKIGTKLKLGNSEIEVMSVKEKQEDLNDTSIVLKLTYNNISFLFTGDISSNVEKELLNKNIESTVLKVAHHGSKYSNSATFLKKVNPKYAVISCGINNDYNHPHDVVIEKLEKMNLKIYRTDQLGTIVAISDGNNITFKNFKTDTNGG